MAGAIRAGDDLASTLWLDGCKGLCQNGFSGSMKEKVAHQIRIDTLEQVLFIAQEMKCTPILKH
jgi:hypothetical protein